jgi:transposase
MIAQGYVATLDVSVAKTSICILDPAGEVFHEEEVPTDASAIAAALWRTSIDLEFVGLEAGSGSQQLASELASRGFQVKCMETRLARAINAAKINKNDRNDAQGLARQLKFGFFTEVHIKGETARATRAVLGLRNKARRQRTQLHSIIRSTLIEAGLRLPAGANKNFPASVRELIEGHPTLAPLMESHLGVWSSITQVYSDLHELSLEIAKNDPVCGLLMTMHGLGPIGALSYRAVIDDPARFRDGRSVAAYLGLTPAQYQSGATDLMLGISKRGDIGARTALYEAAHTMLTLVRKESGLRSWGLTVANRRGAKKAKVAVARRMAIILHRMWTDWTPFDPEWSGQGP